MASQPVQAPAQVQLAAQPETARGVPANNVSIISNLGGVVLTFVSYTIGEPTAYLTARVVMTAECALAMLEILKQNLEAFEATNGPIRRGIIQAPEIVFDSTKAS